MTHLLKEGELIAGRYAVDKFIGEGGMQEVYRATDISLGRVVALKIPKNPSAKKRFRRSAAMSAKVTHPNVAKTFDYLVDGEREFLIEELILGNDLGDLLSQRYLTLDPHLAGHVIHHLAKGLAAVHKVGVTHRDLKPKNIMVSDDYDISVIKITDFGIAKMAEVEIAEGLKDDNATLASQTVLGAIPYMAPEVLQNRNDVSTRADIWSVGAILYSLLVGQPPFGGGVAAVANILAAKGPPTRPPALSSSGQFGHLLDDLWNIAASCLSVDPDKRPSAEELVSLCNSLCYSREYRMVGVIQSYKPRNGNWGFIKFGDAGDSIFFHIESFWGSGVPQVGARVIFSSFPGFPNPRANPVLLLRD